MCVLSHFIPKKRKRDARQPLHNAQKGGPLFRKLQLEERVRYLISANAYPARTRAQFLLHNTSGTKGFFRLLIANLPLFNRSQFLQLGMLDTGWQNANIIAHFAISA
jgi:hypothetical protein